MRARCISLGGAKLFPLDAAGGYLPTSIFHLTLHKEYIVYGILVSNAVVRYLIANDYDHVGWAPASLFEIKCDRASRLWAIAIRVEPNQYYLRVTFSELTRNDELYERFLDREPEAQRIFNAWRRLADLEFPDPLVKETATAIEGDWLLCPFCLDAWESKSAAALLECPTCKRVSNNPRYSAD